MIAHSDFYPYCLAMLLDDRAYTGCLARFEFVTSWGKGGGSRLSSFEP